MQKDDYAVSLKRLFHINPASNQNYNIACKKKVGREQKDEKLESKTT
jgi:hypothetical protein